MTSLTQQRLRAARVVSVVPMSTTDGAFVFRREPPGAVALTPFSYSVFRHWCEAEAGATIEAALVALASLLGVKPAERQDFERAFLLAVGELCAANLLAADGAAADGQ